MRWEAAPKPRLTDLTYKKNYLPEGISIEERYGKIEKADFKKTSLDEISEIDSENDTEKDPEISETPFQHID